MSEPDVFFSKVVIIGVGLIGSSFARALKQRNLCEQIVGCGRSLATLEDALALGVIDVAETDLQLAVQGADLVFLAMPIGATETVLASIAPYLEAKTIITDAGSVKCNVIDAARRVFGDLPAHFIPGHPIAGSERSGVAAGKADLFEHHKVILTPLPENSVSALAAVRAVWAKLGAEVIVM
ncbi:MAG TPA: prephenate dehydrogenase/arogenate dehydrogenase family protein, partial [Pseudomonadales bacterium]|nr:prephenate dehydrogenase/arogenate dehydrogenase family protein [Pseudomonadales bacterium]